MRSLLVLLMVLMVSGNDERTVDGILGDDVILPCPCIGRNLTRENRWQVEQESKEVMVLKWLNNKVVNGSTYNPRAKTFQDVDKYNCSLLLTNITADDKGKYNCIFTKGLLYTISFVHLRVSAHFNYCVSPVTKLNGSLRARECHVEGRYRDAEILWFLDEKPLTNSTTTTIWHTHTTETPNHHTFSSKIMIELNGTSEPICKVESKNISINISYCQPPVPLEHISVPARRGIKVFSVLLLVGVFLILLYRWKFSWFTADDESGEFSIPVAEHLPDNVRTPPRRFPSVASCPH